MNIYDYVDYYKNVTLDSAPWNIIDNLVCALFSYAPLDNFSHKSFDEFISDINNYVVRENSNVTIPLLKELCIHLVDSLRYRDLVLTNFTKLTNDKTQFGAVVIKINNIKVISFEGSDGSSVGWLENFRCMYEYPTFTQRLAIEYLNNNISSLDDEVYIVGHSKGGNMAMASAMEMDDNLFNKITKIINFDGPGFRNQEYRSSKYKRLSKKLINIIPSNSYVGMLLYNNKYTIVKSLSNTSSCHYPTNWEVFGEFFVKDKISNFSKKLHAKTTSGLKNVDIPSAKYAIELIFDEIIKEKKSLYDLKASDIVSIYKSIRSVDDNTFDYIFSLITATIFNNKK